MKKLYFLVIVAHVLVINLTVLGQGEPIILEAEDADVGSEFNILTDGDITYITIGTDVVNTGNPGRSERVLTFEVTFPDSGYYDFYARVRVGYAADNDDSFFYGTDFGTMDVESDDDWIRVNNISGIGFSEPDEYVYGVGGAPNGEWKWMNFSENTGDETPIVFHVEPDNLTLTFQIGGRENGLDFDKIAFCNADLYYTVSNLDNGEAGIEDPPIEIVVPDGPPLATGKCKYLGSAYSEYQALYFERLWNQVIPENGGKWGSVEVDRDVMNWDALDSAYYLAKNNNFPFNLHVLLWGNQQPTWIETLTTQEQREEIEEWFDTLAARYDDIDVVQVVNEPLHAPPNSIGHGNYIDALGGTGSTGWDWIIEAFTLARNYFPESELMINDYSIVNNQSTAQNYIQIIELLQAEDLIDAIGIQGHAFSTGAAASEMKANLDLLAETGLPVYVTEMDIAGATDDTQLSEYQRIFPVFWEHPAVKGITLWGYRPGLWISNAQLLNADGSERPAMTWLIDYVSNTYFDGDCIVTSLTDEPAFTITLFPNPAINGNFTISGLENISSLRILNLNGRLISELEVSNHTMEIQIEAAPGVYLIQCISGKGNLYKKIILN